MINFKNTLGTILMLTFLISCTNEKSEVQHVNPKAFQDKKQIEYKSYSRSGDITEELYAELVSNNPALQKLEDELNAFNPDELNSKFSNYDEKSSSYYKSVDHKTAAITDTILKQKMMDLIAMSKQNYEGNTAVLNSLIRQVSNNGATINDHHSVLKIILTLPLMEEYQKSNKPSTNGFKGLINEQHQLIQRIDSLTPAY